MMTQIYGFRGSKKRFCTEVKRFSAGLQEMQKPKDPGGTKVTRDKVARIWAEHP